MPLSVIPLEESSYTRHDWLQHLSSKFAVELLCSRFGRSGLIRWVANHYLADISTSFCNCSRHLSFKLQGMWRRKWSFRDGVFRWRWFLMTLLPLQEAMIPHDPFSPTGGECFSGLFSPCRREWFLITLLTPTGGNGSPWPFPLLQEAMVPHDPSLPLQEAMVPHDPSPSYRRQWFLMTLPPPTGGDGSLWPFSCRR